MGFNGDLESLTIHPASLPIQTITKCDGAVVHNNVTTLIPLLLQLYLARSEGDKQVLQICYRLCSNNYLIWSVRSHCFHSKDHCLFRGTEKLNNTWVLNDLLWPAIPRALQFICRKCTQIVLYLRFHTVLYRLLGGDNLYPSPRHSVLIVEPFVSMFIPQNSL